MEYKMAFAGNLNKSKKEFNTKIPGQIGILIQMRFRQQQNQYKNFAWLFKG